MHSFTFPAMSRDTEQIAGLTTNVCTFFKAKVKKTLFGLLNMSRAMSFVIKALKMKTEKLWAYIQALMTNAWSAWVAWDRKKPQNALAWILDLSGTHNGYLWLEILSPFNKILSLPVSVSLSPIFSGLFFGSSPRPFFSSPSACLTLCVRTTTQNPIRHGDQGPVSWAHVKTKDLAKKARRVTATFLQANFQLNALTFVDSHSAVCRWSVHSKWPLLLPLFADKFQPRLQDLSSLHIHQLVCLCSLSCA